MKLFIGTKTVLAKPMNRQEYNDYRGWELPSDENGNDEGFLVEYADGGQANHRDHQGYISWSPKEVFRNSYNDVNVGCDFGHAVTFLKAGFRVQRSGWNGKGMFLYYVPANVYPTQTVVAKRSFGHSVQYGAYIAMYTAQGNVVPWTPSQTDQLADDWLLFETDPIE